MFTAAPRKVGGAYDQVVVKVAGDLADATGMHTFTVTINGRASLGRTAVASVKINVTASNNPPVISGTDAAGKLIIPLTESSKSEDFLVDRMTGPADDRTVTVIHDFAVNVDDDTSDSSLVYTPVGNYAPFEISGTKLVISDAELKDTELETAAVADEPSTTTCG